MNPDTSDDNQQKDDNNNGPSRPIFVQDIVAPPKPPESPAPVTPDPQPTRASESASTTEAYNPTTTDPIEVLDTATPEPEEAPEPVHNNYSFSTDQEDKPVDGQVPTAPDLPPGQSLEDSSAVEMPENSPVESSTPPEITEQPVPAMPEPIQSGEVAVDPSSPTPLPSMSADAPAPAMPAHHEHKSKTLIILVAILVGLILAAAAIYIYIRTNDSAEPETSDNNQSTQSASLTPAEVETTNTEIQAAIDSLKDTEDFDDAKISDATLGL